MAEGTQTPTLLLAQFGAMSVEEVRRDLAALADALAGQAAFLAGDDATARRKMEGALAEFRKIEDDNRAIQVLSRLALIRERESRFAEAVELLEEAAIRSRRIASTLAEEEVLSKLAVYRALAGHERFEDPLREAIRLAETRGVSSAASVHRLSLARLCLMRGDSGVAKRELRAAIESVVSDLRLRAEVFALFGKVHIGERDFGQAGIDLAEASRALDELGERGGALRAEVQLSLARISFWRGRLPEAEGLARVAVESWDQGLTVANASFLRGRVLHVQGNHESALSLFDEAAQAALLAGNPETEAAARVNAAQCLRALRRPSDASSRVAPILADPRFSPRSGAFLAARVVLARCALDEGNAGTAESLAREAAESIEAALPEIETGLALDYAVQEWPFRAFETAIQAVLRNDHSRVAEAFELSERSKARAFLEELERYGIDPNASAPPELQAARQAALHRVGGVSTAIHRERDAMRAESLRAALARALQDLEAASTALRRAVGAKGGLVPRPSTFEQAQALVSGNRVLLEYFVGEDRSWLFLLGEDRSEVFALPAAADLGREVDSYLSLLRQTRAVPGLRQRFFDASRALAMRLLPGGLWQRIAGREVYLVPDGPLFGLPFESLAAPGADRGLRLLGDDCVFAYAPSAGLLAVLADRPLALKRGILAAANPEAPGVQRLPFGEAEARAAAARFPKDRSKVITGASFRKSALLGPLERAGVLHLVAHTTTRNQQLGLRLTPEEGNPDGVFRFNEAIAIASHPDLVVLSSCETAGGESSPGMGVRGLVYSFIFAGASRVVVSQWPVEDAKAPELMSVFYDRLLETRSVPLALALARRSLGSPHEPDPFVQAAFVAYGPF
ncbi:MAG: CHAT domain-containing protein [Planctomycetes bacterium]|nr:CHAT domain-containing protein [Planctomycetota bacterium]